MCKICILYSSVPHCGSRGSGNSREEGRVSCARAGCLHKWSFTCACLCGPVSNGPMAWHQAAHRGLGTSAVQDYSHFFLFYVWAKSYVCCKEKSLKKIDLKEGKLMKNLMTGNKCLLWYQWEVGNILPSRSHVISFGQKLLLRSLSKIN